MLSCRVSCSTGVFVEHVFTRTLSGPVIGLGLFLVPVTASTVLFSHSFPYITVYPKIRLLKAEYVELQALGLV